MSSLSTFTLKESIIPLVSMFDMMDIHTTKVEHKCGNREYMKMHLPVCSDPSNKELFPYVIDQFLDAVHQDCVHLTTGPQLYNMFYAVVDGAICISWQSISDTCASKLVDTFSEDLTTLITEYFMETLYQDQV